MDEMGGPPMLQVLGLVVERRRAMILEAVL